MRAAFGAFHFTGRESVSVRVAASRRGAGTAAPHAGNTVPGGRSRRAGAREPPVAPPESFRLRERGEEDQRSPVGKSLVSNVATPQRIASGHRSWNGTVVEAPGATPNFFGGVTHFLKNRGRADAMAPPRSIGPPLTDHAGRGAEGRAATPRRARAGGSGRGRVPCQSGWSDGAAVPRCRESWQRPGRPEDPRGGRKQLRP
jgi:hypothetical protein